MGRTLANLGHVVHHASEGDKFNADTTLMVVDCPTCGITYAIPESLQRSARKWHGDRPNGWKIVCPLGHEWWYTGETDLERERRLKQEANDRAGRLASDLDQTTASLRAQKAAATRARNEKKRMLERIANGVCPCCNRSFTNVCRHMATKHPDVLADLPE